MEGNSAKPRFKDCLVFGIKTILHDICLRKHYQTTMKIQLRPLKGSKKSKDIK